MDPTCRLAEEMGILDCSICKLRRKCNAWALLCDLNATRYTCPKCFKSTREEHVQYCPFCGTKINWKKYTKGLEYKR